MHADKMLFYSRLQKRSLSHAEFGKCGAVVLLAELDWLVGRLSLLGLLIVDVTHANGVSILKAEKVRRI